MVQGKESFCCPVCDAAQYRVLMDKQVAHPLWWLDDYPELLQLRYVLCEACGYICLRPHLSAQQYDAIYRHSPGLDRETIKETRQSTLRQRKAFIDQHAVDLTTGTVVEVGPAYGDFLNLFPSFKRRLGIEPSTTYLNTVRQESPALEYHPFVLEDFVEHQPAFCQSADLVLACHVLEHAFDPRVFVENLARLAARGAYVYIEVPSIEGMARTKKPRYQNLYYGHVSQFTAPVIRRLGVMCGLTPVEIVHSHSDDYPVIRALFRKTAWPEMAATAFQRHRAQTEQLTAAALTRLSDVLRDGAMSDIVIWGCGQDLLDLVLALPAPERQLFGQKVTLVDRNPGKQGRTFFGKKILPPAHASRADVVLIATHSQILGIDIGRDVAAMFSHVPLINLYELLPE